MHQPYSIKNPDAMLPSAELHFSNETKFNYFNEFDTDISKYEKRSLLIEPHGGSLVSRIGTESDIQELSKLPNLEVDERVVSDCEQIALAWRIINWADGL